MHSCPIMVESMSARNSFFRRAAAGCTTISMPLVVARKPFGKRALVYGGFRGKGNIGCAGPEPQWRGLRPAMRRARFPPRWKPRLRSRSGSRHESCDARYQSSAAYCRADR